MAASNNDNAIHKRKRESCEIAAKDDMVICRPGPSTSIPQDTSQPNCYEIVDIHQWLNGWTKDTTNDEDDDASRVTLPLVDLRSYDNFDKQHLSSSPMVATITDVKAAKSIPHTKINTGESTNNEHTNVTIVNLPLSTLLSGERSCELPPRHVEFAILIPAEFIKKFHKKEDCSIHELFFASESKSTRQSRKPWLVRQVLMDDDRLWKAASDKIGLVQWCGRGSTSSNRDGTFPFQSLPRLWKPDPLISSDILPLLKEWILDKNPRPSDEKQDVFAVNIKSDDIKEKSVGLVLDLGSGAGRDICYLAEELKQCQQQSLLLQQQQSQQTKSMRSIHFIGIDNHKGSAKRCLPLWTNRGVNDVTNSCNLDLNKLHRVRDHFMNVSKLQSPRPVVEKQSSTILCIFAIRFLNRRLLSYIANSQSMHEASPSIAPASFTTTSKNAMHEPPPPLVLPLGTLIAISHFCKPEEGASWNFDHPKESSVLNRCELKHLFGGVVCENSDGDNDVQRWNILKDDIVPDGDHGRTLIQFVVRKVA